MTHADALFKPTGPTTDNPSTATRRFAVVTTVATVLFAVIAATCVQSVRIALSRSQLPSVSLLHAQARTNVITSALARNTSASTIQVLLSTSAACASSNSSRNWTLTPLHDDAPRSLRKYATWHAQARLCLCDPGCNTPVRVLVWRCAEGTGCAGIGDRIRGINVLFLLAMGSERVLFIDLPQGIHSPFSLTAALRPAAIDWTLPACNTLNDVPHLNWHNLESATNAPLPDGSRFNIVKDDLFTRLRHYPQVAIGVNSGIQTFGDLLRRYNNAGRFLDLHSDVLPVMHALRAFALTLFTPSNAVQSRLRGVLPPQFALGFVGVHARTGEDVNEKNNRRFRHLRNTTLVAAALLRCAQLADARRTQRVFLASDAHSVKREFVRLARRHHVQVALVPAKAIHLMAPAPTDHYNDRDLRNTICDDYLNVFVDLVGLASADAVVMTGSGFARAAYFLGNASDLRVAISKDGPVCDHIRFHL